MALSVRSFDSGLTFITEITLSSLPIFIPLTPLVDLPIGLTSPSENLIAFPDSEARHTSSFPSVIMVPINLSPSSRLIALKPGAPGLRAINLDEGDKLIGTIITDGKDEVCLASESGKAIRFSEGDVRPMGRSTRGVRGMNIGKEDKVISVIKVNPESKLLTLSANGYGKRTNISEFSGQKRGGKGVIALNTSPRNGKMVAAVQVVDGDEVMHYFVAINYLNSRNHFSIPW